DVSRVLHDEHGHSTVCSYYDEANFDEVVDILRSGKAKSELYPFHGRAFMLEGQENKPPAKREYPAGKIGIVVDVPRHDPTEKRKYKFGGGISGVRKQLKSVGRSRDRITRNLEMHDVSGEVLSLPHREKISTFRRALYRVLDEIGKKPASSMYATGYYRPTSGADQARGEYGKLEEVAYREFVFRLQFPYLDMIRGSENIDEGKLLNRETEVENMIIDGLRREIYYELPVIIMPEDIERWIGVQKMPQKIEGVIRRK
ncbi:MAG: hypothetical protein KKC05_03885, partial [Nanoarchaeota archaeon]|nr:hypothetical protein [Nanoarchaeota archaeon]